MPKIKADITDSTAKNLSEIKKLLVASGGEVFNDTGRTIEYCVTCAITQIQSKWDEMQAAAKAAEDKGIISE